MVHVGSSLRYMQKFSSVLLNISTSVSRMSYCDMWSMWSQMWVESINHLMRMWGSMSPAVNLQRSKMLHSYLGWDNLFTIYWQSKDCCTLYMAWELMISIEWASATLLYPLYFTIARVLIRAQVELLGYSKRKLCRRHSRGCTQNYTHISRSGQTTTH